MNWLLNLPVRRKLMVISALAATIALLLSGIMILGYELMTYRRDKVQEIVVHAEILAARVNAALAFNDAKAAQEYLEAFRSINSIDSAGIYNADGQLFAAYTRKDLAEEAPPAHPSPTGETFIDNNLLVFRPVTTRSHPIGSIYIRMRIEPFSLQLMRYTGMLLLVMMGSLLITLPMTSRLHRAIANPLLDLGDAARRIAEGEIFAPPMEERQDEIGLLQKRFQLMAKSLQEKADVAKHIAEGDLAVQVTMASDRDVLGKAFAAMVSNLQEKASIASQIATGDLTVKFDTPNDRDILGKAFVAMIHNLREINRDLRDGVNVLSSATGLILSGTSQIASGAGSMATAINETTTTVEEIKQTALLSTQKARNVSEAAEKVAHTAKSGLLSVEQLIDGMQQIREKMEWIAESIVRLSEQTNAIGEIFSSVRDLSEQSNLLAVNASIEAAKAGEQGKGFAVVAQEIKFLAEQSKQATAQVRNILSDIQKASNSSVLAAEQGSKTVDIGVKQSHSAGDAIRQLADSVSDSAMAANHIAVSAQQQLAGMDQLARAIENIKATVLQNHESTQQAEAAAHNLHELGQRLFQQINRYRV